MKKFASFIAASLIAAVVTSTPSHAAGPDTAPGADYYVTAKSITAGGPVAFSRFHYTVVDATAETKVNIQVIGCGGAVVFETNKQRSGTYEFDIRPDASKMGTDWKLVTTITEPGRPINRSTNSKFTPDWNFSCSGMDSRPAVKVSKWSSKAGKAKQAKVGKSLRITRTTAEAGAKITYRWKVNGKTVDRDRSLKVKRAYKGKRIKVVVRVAATGKATRTKVISYGKARR